MAGVGSPLPSGIVTFLFTDIEGSTRRWDAEPAAMRAALDRHDRIVRRAVEAHDGHVFRSMGDAFCAVFASAPDAVAGALATQRELRDQRWETAEPLGVRIAIHTGEAERHEGDYVGACLNRIARLLAAGHGGQTLLSAVVQQLVSERLPPGAVLRDLGEHRLKDLQRPERVFELTHADLPGRFPPPRTLATRPNNLPLQRTALVGREREIAAVVARLRLPDVRLLTLTGPGGAGKTRLALQVAAEMLDDFEDGAFFVDLAPLTNPDLVLPTVARTLGLREIGGLPLPESLAAYLRDRELLLLLDNFEQVVAAAPALAELLLSCARLKLLVTSRVVLRLYGEHDLPIPPLALPERAASPRPDELGRNEAVRLFAERARAASPDFVLTDQNAAAVAELCRRLDGLPLAIELAAARTRLLTPAALLARLESTLGALPLLVGGARDLPARQQTLRETIGWSYALLDSDQRRLLHRLAVFSGGCTLDVAEAVCAALGAESADTLTGLGTLVDHSLLDHDEPSRTRADGGGESRIRMLATIREFALECLETSGEAAATRRAHAAHYVGLAERAEPELRGGAQAAWLDSLDAEHANLRAALAWSLDQGDAEAALRLGGTLWRFWYIRGYLSEGRRWLDRALAADAGAPTLARARALAGAGVLAHYHGDQGRAVTLCGESLAICRALGDRAGVAAALNGLALVARMGGDYPAARALYQEALAIQRELGDTWGIAYTLTYSGIAAYVHGDAAGARRPIEEGLALFRQAGDRIGTARALSILGEIARGEGDLVAARASAGEALAIMRELGDRVGATRALTHLAEFAALEGDHAEARRLYAECVLALDEMGDAVSLAPCLESLAWSVVALGGPGPAATLLGAASALRDRSAGPVLPYSRPGLDRAVAGARATLGEAAFETAWSEGLAMTPAQAIAAALASTEPALPPASAPAPSPTPAAAGPLTRREREVATLVARGASNRQIAQALVIADRTAERHLENILAKLGVQSRTQVALWAVEHGFAATVDG